MSKESSVMKAWEATLRKTQQAKKRANSIFGSTYGEEQQQDGSGSCDFYHADRVLPNGDYYTGQWSENFPHGQGKYLWTDGCMYVGEWVKGKTMGMGRFSWPTGTTYEGEFKSGYMDGSGTYTSSNGDTYKGHWIMNLKHGYGVKSFSCGDWYEGEWKRGLQEGQGKYQWKDGNYYSGEWRNGTISGKGSFFWMSGDRFDGYWEDGLPKGQGTFQCSDGSFYVGNWSKDPIDQNGAYYPSGSSETDLLEWDPQQVYTDLSVYRVCPGEKVSIMPSQKRLAVWNSIKGPGSKPRRTSVDGRVSVGLERPLDRTQLWDGDEMIGSVGGRTAMMARELEEELLGPQMEAVAAAKLKQGLPMKLPRKSRRQGELICKGHKNYELMLNLQLGIRHSVGRPAPAVSLDLKPTAFDPKEKMWTRFPPEGSKHTPPHQSSEFRWKDYCPVVFRALRKLFKVDPAEYMLSICGNDALREFSSPGKSGSFFYLTNDDHYMIKTLKKAEAKVLIKMLSAYYNHCRAYENTLVTRFYGLHCVKLTGTSQKKVRFIIMGNFFCTEYPIHRRFDLKGSSLGRITVKPDSEIDESTIFKDLDLNFIFRLPKPWFQDFCRQIDRDCELLEQEGIMDYSLLVGIHFRDATEEGDLIPCSAKPSSGDSDQSDATPRLSRADVDQLLIDPSWWDRIRLGVNMPARVEKTVRTNDCELQLVGDPTGNCYDVVLYFGIIDILQDYDITKKLEHAYKSFQYDPTSISAVDPRQYSKRFRDFIFKIYVEDT